MSGLLSSLILFSLHTRTGHSPCTLYTLRMAAPLCCYGHTAALCSCVLLLVRLRSLLRSPHHFSYSLFAHRSAQSTAPPALYGSAICTIASSRNGRVSTYTSSSTRRDATLSPWLHTSPSFISSSSISRAHASYSPHPQCARRAIRWRRLGDGRGIRMILYCSPRTRSKAR